MSALDLLSVVSSLALWIGAILRVCLVGSEVVSFQYLKMKPFYSAFVKKNRMILFFWLKNRMNHSNSILCLVRESYECRGEERG
jgi:hypothetical protein